MIFGNWQRWLKKLSRTNRGRVAGPKRARSAKPRLEMLEGRDLMAGLYVDNAGDFAITGDQGTLNVLDAGDIVTWTPGAGSAYSGPVQNLKFGTDAFTSIQSAVDHAAQTGDTIYVAAGTYVGQVNVTKSLTLLGANAGLHGDDVRGAESIVLTDVPGPDSVLIYVAASNVTIDGFNLDGDNPELNGADVDAVEAIAAYDGVGNITVQNNIIENTSYAGIDFYNYTNGGAVTSNSVIRNNLIQNIGANDSDKGVGVLLYNNFYADVTDNVISNARVGVQTGNFYLANSGATGSISNNEIAARRTGIFYNLHYNNASPFTIANNNITAVTNEAIGNTRWFGIALSSQGTGVDVNVVDNIIDGSGSNMTETAGYSVWNTQASAVSVNGGTVSGVDYGVWVNNYEGYNSNAGNPTQITVDGVNITADDIGVYVLDSASNTNGATVQATITNNTSITTAGGGTGILVSGTDASAAISRNRISDNGTGIHVTNGGSLTSVTENFVTGNTGDGILITHTAGSVAKVYNNDLSGNGGLGVNNQSAATVNASGNWWGSAAGVAAETSGNVDYSPWLTTSADVSANPGFQGNFSNLTVNATSPRHAGQTTGNLQEGIDLATAGGIVYVHTGTYVEQLDINKQLAVIEAEGQDAVIQSPSSLKQFFTDSKPVIYVHDADGVTLRGLTVDGAGQGESNYRFVGIAYHNAGGTIDGVDVENITDTPLSGMQGGTGIYGYANDASSPHTLYVTGSSVHDYQKNGITMYGAGLTAHVTGNTVTGAGPTNLIAQNGIVIRNGATGTIEGNTVSRHQYTGGGTTGAGILVWGGTAAVNNNLITDNDFGIDVDNGGTAAVNNNRITANGTGIDVVDRGSLTSVTENFIIGNTVDGILITDTAGSVAPVFNNDLSGNGGLGINNLSDTSVDATGNWWGTNIANDVAAETSGNVDVNPFLITGKDTSPESGFQGNFNFPAAVNDSFVVDEDNTLNVPAPGVLGNDTDTENSPLTAILVSGPTSGSLTLNLDGSFSYTPNANFNGTDSFIYKANDGALDSNVVTVTITVNAINDAPTGDSLTVRTNEDTSAVITLPGNDVDGDTLTYSVTANPSHGTLSGSGSNLTYTPDQDFHGTDSFVYQVSDGQGGLASATVSITVDSVHDVGSVRVKVVGKRLMITGDNLDNLITVEKGSAPNSYRVTGLAGTQINGRSGSVVFKNVTKGIDANLLGGDDQLVIDGSAKRFKMPGVIKVRTGSGDDVVRLQGVTGTGDLGSSLGNDSIELIDSYFSSLAVDMGNGATTSLLLDGVTVAGRTAVRGGNGADLVRVVDSVFSAPLVRSTVGALSASNPAVQIQTGSGNDTVSLERVRATGRVVVDGGDGSDHYTNSSYSGAVDAVFHNFE